MATIREIAEDLGVALSTVSRSLNDSPAISEATKQRVREAAERLGYRRDVAAAALRSGRSHVLGLVLGDVTNPFFALLAQHVESEARKHGFRIMFGNGEEKPSRQTEVVATLLEYRVDGLLIVPAGRPEPSCVAQMREVPTVAIDRAVPGADFDFVGSDVEGALLDLAAHLRDLGYRRPALITGPQSTTTGAERTQLARAAFQRAGFDRPAESRSRYDAASGERAMTELLGAGRPDVVVCGSSVIAQGAMLSLKQHDMRVGADVGLATFDALPWFEAMTPALTVIDTDVSAMARMAVDVLASRIDGTRTDPSPHTQMTTARLLVRESTLHAAPPPNVRRSGSP